MTAVNWTNITDLAQLPSEANNASGGMFWSSMLYMLWIILMLITISYGFEIAILSSSFLALVLAILLVYAGLIGWYHVVTFAGILLFMFLYITWSNSKR